VRLAKKERLDGLVFPIAIGESHGEIVAAVYVPATGEILLADDLNLARFSRAAILSTNWCMRSSSRAVCMNTSDARECWRRTPTAPKRFISAPGAYGRRPSFFRSWECSRVLAATRTNRSARARDWILELRCGRSGCGTPEALALRPLQCSKTTFIERPECEWLPHSGRLLGASPEPQYLGV
jgi:hypothetical protein